jgi:hypothetical protein
VLVILEQKNHETNFSNKRNKSFIKMKKNKVLAMWEQIYHREHKVKSIQKKGKSKETRKRKRKKSERNI